MRRLLSASIVLLTVLASCGDPGPIKTSPKSTATQDATTQGTTSAGSTPGAGASGGTVPGIDALTTAATNSAKPVVKVPASLPTKLVVTVLKEGSGEAAKNGDIVEVNYVGVRSADGKEFDNSYDRGQTFPVTLGAGGVIKGWDQGLVGAKTGSQIQLDIPAELAYGDSPQGDVIQAGDALTFVIDVVTVKAGPPSLPDSEIPAVNPADVPTVSIPTSEGATELKITEVKPGTGEAAAEGDTAYVLIIGYNGATGEQIVSSWTAGKPEVLPLDKANLLPGLVDAIVGMKVGGRRLVIIPFADAFGAAGNPNMGLPASTDFTVVLDLIALAKAK